MPENHGHPPKLESVDIKYRNGQIERSIDPTKRRWKMDDPKFGNGYAFDIVSWQPR